MVEALDCRWPLLSGFRHENVFCAVYEILERSSVCALSRRGQVHRTKLDRLHMDTICLKTRSKSRTTRPTMYLARVALLKREEMPAFPFSNSMGLRTLIGRPGASGLACEVHDRPKATEAGSTPEPRAVTFRIACEAFDQVSGTGLF